MTKFKTVQDWLKSSPSEEELSKVLSLINKGATSQTRKEIYELESYYKKLARTEALMVKLGLPANKEVQAKMKEVKGQITELSKGLPTPTKREPRAKKEEVVK